MGKMIDFDNTCTPFITGGKGISDSIINLVISAFYSHLYQTFILLSHVQSIYKHCMSATHVEILAAAIYLLQIPVYMLQLNCSLARQRPVCAAR